MSIQNCPRNPKIILRTPCDEFKTHETRNENTLEKRYERQSTIAPPVLPRSHPRPAGILINHQVHRTTYIHVSLSSRSFLADKRNRKKVRHCVSIQKNPRNPKIILMTPRDEFKNTKHTCRVKNHDISRILQLIITILYIFLIKERTAYV